MGGWLDLPCFLSRFYTCLYVLVGWVGGWVGGLWCAVVLCCVVCVLTLWVSRVAWEGGETRRFTEKEEKNHFYRFLMGARTVWGGWVGGWVGGCEWVLYTGREEGGCCCSHVMSFSFSFLLGSLLLLLLFGFFGRFLLLLAGFLLFLLAFLLVLLPPLPFLLILT